LNITKEMLANLMLHSCKKNYKVEKDYKCYCQNCMICVCVKHYANNVKKEGCILYLRHKTKDEKTKILKILQDAANKRLIAEKKIKKDKIKNG